MLNPINTTSPLLNDFLRDITSGDMELLNYLQEVLGSCFNDDRNKIYILHGSNSGKKTLMTLMKTIMKDQMSLCSLSSLIKPVVYDDRRDLGLPKEILKSRVINATGDINSIKETSNLKSLVGGDLSYTYNENGDFLQIRIYRKIFITTDNYIKVDQGALKARMTVIPMNENFHDMDPFIVQKLTGSPEIMTAFHNWLLIGAQRAKNPHIQIPTSINRATEKYFGKGG
jgi:phage/plasmid-associated DNA primase